MARLCFIQSFRQAIKSDAQSVGRWRDGELETQSAIAKPFMLGELFSASRSVHPPAEQTLS